MIKVELKLTFSEGEPDEKTVKACLTSEDIKVAKEHGISLLDEMYMQLQEESLPKKTK
jgi:hypothetical protein